jgi:hypothetical protein
MKWILFLAAGAALLWWQSRQSAAAAAAIGNTLPISSQVDIPGGAQSAQFADPMQTIMPAAVSVVAPLLAPAIAVAQIMATAPPAPAAPSYGVLDSNGGSQINLLGGALA